MSTFSEFPPLPAEIPLDLLQRTTAAVQTAKDGTKLNVAMIMGVPPSVGWPRCTEVLVSRVDGEALRAVDIRAVSIPQAYSARRLYLGNQMVERGLWTMEQMAAEELA